VKGSCYLLLYSRGRFASFVETAIYDDTLIKTLTLEIQERIVWRDDDDITPFKPKLLRSVP